MSIQRYIIIFVLGSVFASTAWAVIVMNIDPISSGVGGLVLFYVTLAMMLCGWLITLGTIVRAIIKRENSLEHSIKTSPRQGLLLTILLIVSLILQRIDLLKWWSVVILVVVIAAIEFFAYEVEEHEKA